MRRILLVLSLLGTATICMGQDQGLVRWADGLQDLSGYQVVEASREAPSFTSFSFQKDRKSVRRDGITYVYDDVTAAIRPNQSWIRTDVKTDAMLAEIRRDFDLMEYFARRYRDSLLTASDKDGALLMEFTRQFQDAGKRIRNGASLSLFALDEEPFDITRLAWEPSKRGGGVTIAGYGVVPFGSLASIVSFGAGASLGFERRWNRHGIYVDAAGAFHQLRKHFFELQGAWKNEKMTPSFVASLNYGLTFVSSRAMRMTLLVGPAFGGYFFTVGDSIASFAGGPGVTEGLCMDFILSRTMSFVSDRPEFADTAIRIKVFGSHFWSLQQPGLIFPSLNLGIGLHFDSRALSRK